MLPSWANDEVTRIRPGTKESRGSTIPDWSQPNVLKISGCSVQPAQTTLSQDGRVLGLTECNFKNFIIGGKTSSMR